MARCVRNIRIKNYLNQVIILHVRKENIGDVFETQSRSVVHMNKRITMTSMSHAVFSMLTAC